MPLDGTIEIIVQDGKNSSVSADITVIPPAPEIDEIYTIGNSGISKGSHENIYARVTALGGHEDISNIDVKLVKGAFSESSPLAGSAQTFSIMDTDAESSFQSSVTTDYNVLYTIPIYVPEFYELTDGTYTYVVSFYDYLLQKGYLPSVRSLMKELGYKSPRSVAIILESLI